MSLLSSCFRCSLLALVAVALTACGEDRLSPITNPGDVQIDGITVSAPLFPRYSKINAIEDERYPQRYEDILTWLDEENPIYSFREMMDFCLEHEQYAAGIIQSPNPAELTQQERNQNYRTVADCAYDFDLGFHSKPYWIPQLLSDADICALELGPEWSIPTEAFVAGKTEAFFEALGQTHTTDEVDHHASIYFSLAIYIKDANGVLKLATLAPDIGESERIREIPEHVDYTAHLQAPFTDPEDPVWHYELINLRCVR